LIDAYRRPLRWSDYVDDSVQALLRLVRAKLQDQTPIEPGLQPTPLLDLMNTLRQSVAALSTDLPADGVRSSNPNTSPKRSF
jgi:non-homologous end joining protein Ku